MPPAPLLYSFRRCPYAMRARMALLHAGVAFDVCEVVLRDKPADLLALSPKGTVPVLRLPDGHVLDESLDIMRWAFHAAGDTGGWWARAQTAVNQSLLAACDGDFKHHLDRFKYPERFARNDDAQASAQARQHHRMQAATALLRPLDAQLRASGQLGGHAPCAADIAIFPFVRQFEAVDPAGFEELALPAVAAWLRGWRAHPLFLAAMHRPVGVHVQPFPVLHDKPTATQPA